MLITEPPPKAGFLPDRWGRILFCATSAILGILLDSTAMLERTRFPLLHNYSIWTSPIYIITAVYLIVAHNVVGGFFALLCRMSIFVISISNALLFFADRRHVDTVKLSAINFSWAEFIPFIWWSGAMRVFGSILGFYLGLLIGRMMRAVERDEEEKELRAEFETLASFKVRQEKEYRRRKGERIKLKRVAERLDPFRFEKMENRRRREPDSAPFQYRLNS